MLIDIHVAGNAELVVDSFHLCHGRGHANLLQALRRNLDRAELRFCAGWGCALRECQGGSDRASEAAGPRATTGSPVCAAGTGMAAMQQQVADSRRECNADGQSHKECLSIDAVAH